MHSRRVRYHRRRTAPLISQHTGFLNAGARACACAHESALGPARAHGALAQPRHLPFPSEETPNRKRAELVKRTGREGKKCLQRLSPINRWEERPGRPERTPQGKHWPPRPGLNRPKPASALQRRSPASPPPLLRLPPASETTREFESG